MKLLYVQDILKQAMEDRLSSAADLPYFEGDFWPNVLEESIKELDQEEEEKRKQAEAAEAAAAAANAVSCVRQMFLFVCNNHLSHVIYIYICMSSCLFRYFRYPKTRKLQTVRRRARRRRKNPTNLKRIKGKIARNRILLRPAMIFPRKSLPPWKNTRRCSSSLGCTAHKVQPV